ncbi:MAG: hypothetical protein WAM89_08055 [Terriglobales bacterium]
MASRAKGSLVALLALSLWGCSGPPAGDSAGSQKLPFDRQPGASGISPSRSLIPSTTKLPEGTAIAVRLQTAVSSATSHVGDRFYAIVDQPVEIDGQTLVARGTAATGRVLEAKAAGDARENSPEAGYLRIVLVSLTVEGKTVAVYTSSIFARGGSRDERNAGAGGASGMQRTEKEKVNKDVEFGVDRHLNFRLAQTIDLQ